MHRSRTPGWALATAIGLATPATASNIVGDADRNALLLLTDAAQIQSVLVGADWPSTLYPMALVDADTDLTVADVMLVGQAAVWGLPVLVGGPDRLAFTPPAPVTTQSGGAPIRLIWTVESSVPAAASRVDGLEVSFSLQPSGVESLLTAPDLQLLPGGLAAVTFAPINTTGAVQNLEVRLRVDFHNSQQSAIAQSAVSAAAIAVGPSVCGNGMIEPGEVCDEGETDECVGNCNGTCTGPAHVHCGLCPEGTIRVGGVCEAAGAIFQWHDASDAPGNPFPDDRYRDGSGSITVPPWSFLEFADPAAFAGNPDYMAFAQQIAAHAQQYATGFGTFSPLEFSLSAAIDPATLPAGMYVIGLDTMTLWSWTWTAEWFGSVGRLDLHPEMPLDSASRYGVIVTGAVKTPGGEPLGYDRDFRNQLGLDPSGDLGLLIGYATGTLGLARDAIAGAFTFSTEETWQDLWTIRTRLDSGNLATATPGFSNLPNTPYTEGIFNSGSMKNSLLGAASPYYKTAAVGNVDLHNFRGADLVWDPDLVAVGGATTTDRVRFHMAIPNLTTPPQGFPLVVIGHGLGGSASFAWEIANIADNHLPIAPMVLLAHDHPHHGYRGTGDSDIDLFNYFNLSNFYILRDNFRQTACDILQVRRMVRQAALTDTPPFNHVDPDRLYYLGSSLGGINGATFLGVDSQVETAVLNVPAATLVKILEGQEFGAVLLPAILSAFGIAPGDPGFDEFFRVLINRGLWIMGAGDPINYAPFVHRAGMQLPGSTRKNVLIQLGVGDTLLPNETTRTLARVMDIPTLSAESRCFTPGCRVSGMWEFDPIDYGFPTEEPHELARYLLEAQEQILTYAESDGSWILDASPP